MFSKLLDILNDLRPKQLLLLAGASALLIFGLLYVALSGLTTVKEAPPAATQEFKKPMRSVVVAKEDIPSRTILSADLLEVRDMPPSAVPQGAAMNMEEVLNRPAVSTIYAGDVVTMQKIFTNQSQAGFVGTIPPNCRAVSVGISEITGVAGFAKPGDHVDVVLVEKGEQAATSQLLLQDVLLLGVNQTMEGEAKDGKENPSIATLALEPDSALQLVSAAAIGEIHLILRPFQPSDMYVNEPSHTLLSSYMTRKAAPAPQAPPVAPAAAAAPAPAPAAPSSGIQIIQGDKILQN